VAADEMHIPPGNAEDVVTSDSLILVIVVAAFGTYFGVIVG
jgi:hypothetical protein